MGTGKGKMRGNLPYWAKETTYSITDASSGYGNSFIRGNGTAIDVYLDDLFISFKKEHIVLWMLTDVVSFRCESQRKRAYKYWGLG